MRLRKDSTSWKAMGLKAKAAPIPEQPIAHSKKDTKRWCKGVVGREHDYELLVPPNDSKLLAGFRKLPICANCGRQDNHGTLYRQKDGSYDKHPDWHSHA